MSKERERPSHSAAVHRRRVLAQERREPSPALIGRQPEEPQRLSDVVKLLKSDSLISQERASLEVEAVWLQFKSGRMSSSNRQSTLTRLLDNMEKTQPEVYRWLTIEGKDGVSPLTEIRDKVIPPVKIAGYHTKR